MITAEQANRVTIRGASKKEIKELESAIISAARDGKKEVWHYNKLSEGAKYLLVKNGYAFHEQFDRNEYLVKIVWDSKADA